MRATRMGGPARPVAQPRRTPDLALRSPLATSIALAGLGVVTGVLSVLLLHPAGEGELAAIQTWPLLLGTLAMLGLDSALVYFISRPRQRQAAYVNSRLHRSPVFPGGGWHGMACTTIRSPCATAASSRRSACIPPDRRDLRGGWHSPRLIARRPLVHRVEPLSQLLLALLGWAHETYTDRTTNER